MKLLRNAAALSLSLIILMPALVVAQGQQQSRRQRHDDDAATAAFEQLLANYKLTPDNIRKSTGVSKALAQKMESDPAVAQRYSNANQKTASSLDEAARMLEADPTMVGLLKAGGISARDYLATVIVTSFMYVGALSEKSAGADDPGMTPVAKQNAALIKSDASDVKALYDAMSHVDVLSAKGKK